MEQYTYLLVNIFSLFIPLALSFESKIAYYKKWKFLFPALTITAAVFLVWDALFTTNGVWGFNPKYLTGIYICNLPLEEILFFFCIPYSSIFAYEALKLLKFSFAHYQFPATILLLLVCAGGIVFYHNKLYTFYTALFLLIFLLLQLFYIKGNYLGMFYFSYLIILIPFTIVNGLLTGSWIAEPVVWYNNNENMGIRFLTIPVEDIFYGMLMLLMSVSIYEKLKG